MADRRHDVRQVRSVSGRVQGVGFRWWVRRHADALGLTGWVMNADDERSVAAGRTAMSIPQKTCDSVSNDDAYEDSADNRLQV